MYLDLVLVYPPKPAPLPSLPQIRSLDSMRRSIELNGHIHIQPQVQHAVALVQPVYSAKDRVLKLNLAT
jgi:hypothetical protein